MPDPSPSPDRPHGAPYVGLRPYERSERELLTGRDRDARFLADKVFSARLTLLYAPSGLGKSSLLRAMVIPDLEEAGCRTLYLDAWAGDEPEAELRRALHGLATEVGQGDLLDASAPPIDLVRLLTADGHTLVLVLDQFEEFLFNHAQQMDPLRKVLATLVRTSGLDLRMVISLREEFLANLEPFRELILDLFQCTYRLEPLDDQGVRAAIVQPAQRFGWSYEPQLVDRLVADLGSGRASAAGMAQSEGVDLPMMQIVCLELWAAAQARWVKQQALGKGDHESRTLKQALYQELGGADAILDRYVRKVMPKTWRDCLLTARLMIYMAPASGRKISYAVSDLASMSRVDARRIEAELRRLAKVSIVRIRQFGSGARFELWHDALIARIGPWRDRVLQRQHRFRIAGWVGLGLASVLAILVVLRLGEVRDMGRYSDDRLQQLACAAGAPPGEEAQATFDQVAGYLIGHQRTDAAQLRLKDLGQRYVHCLPPDYGFNSVSPNLAVEEAAASEWPLVLRVNPEREFDPEAFLPYWQQLAVELTSLLGIPVPERIVIRHDETQPRGLVRLESAGRLVTELAVSEPELPAGADAAAAAVIRIDNAPEPARQFHQHFHADWVAWEPAALPNARVQGSWWAVPRWSLPAWKAAGVKLYRPSVTVALALKAQLLAKPGGLLTEAALRFLVERHARYHGDVAARELRLALCRGLRDELVRLVDGGYALTHADLAFDALVGVRPERWRATLQVLAREGYVHALQAGSSQVLGGPAPAPVRGRCELDKPTDAAAMAPYKGVEVWLPLPLPVRIPIGLEHERAWAPGRSLAPWVQEAISTMRERLYAQAGVSVPGLRFRSATAGMGALDYRLGLLDREEEREAPQRLQATGEEGLQTLLGDVAAQMLAAAPAWVTPDAVALILQGASPELRDWLLKRYSTGELVLVMRSVLAPGAGADSAAAGQTLRHPEWLLGALVFWDAAPGNAKRTVGEAAAFLRELQRVRLEERADAAGSVADRALAPTVEQLLHGRVEPARQGFEAALREADAAAVRAAFVRQYAASQRDVLLAVATAACEDPTQPHRAHGDDNRLRTDLDELLDDRRHRLPEGVVRRLALCGVAALPSERSGRQLQLARELAQQTADSPASWAPQHGLWLGQLLLQRHDPLRDPASSQALGTGLLGAALERLPEDEAAGEYDKLLRHCDDNRKPNAWCWPVMEQLAQRLAANPWVALDLAGSLSNRVDALGPDIVTRWLDEGERRLRAAKLSPSDLEQGQAWLRMYRASTSAAWVRPGHEAEMTTIERELLQLKADLQKPKGRLSALLTAGLEEQIDFTLVQLALHKRLAWRDAEQLALEAAQRWPKSANFQAEAFYALLMQGRTEEAVALLDRIEQIAADPAVADELRQPFLLYAAMGRLLTGQGHWEQVARSALQTDHEYVQILAILLHHRMSGSAADDARDFIDRRWRKVDRSRWTQRMQQGDGSAWYELLLGYYLGEVGVAEVIPVLEDDARFKASAFARLPYPRQGLLSDAYFYDALRRQRLKDPVGMKGSLQHVVDMQVTDYTEYFMARYLLSQKEQRTGSGSEGSSR